MILVDPRTGSREIARFLASHQVLVKIGPEMDAGDFAFEGNGPDGICLIGVERKTVRDMLQSIRTGRFSGHQLPLLVQMYRFQYLIIEGIFRSGPDGVLEEPRQRVWAPLEVGGARFMYQELVGALCTLEQMVPSLHIHYTYSAAETAARVVSLYRWWTSKDFTQHRAHQVCPAGRVEILGKWSRTRRVAKEFYKIGQENSLAVARHFRTIRRMVNAEAVEWAAIDLPCGGQKTRRLGAVIAEQIVRGMDEEE